MPDTTTRTRYDEVPYVSHPYPQSHPDRLSTLGGLFGLSPAPVTACRVLELGCASGGNLIPMAFHLPGSEFVGVDLSQREVESGVETIRRLGLENIRLEHGSLADVDSAYGSFDYIISHGVYSWISDSEQERLLAVSAENLAPQGVAYVSYNTYPGWHMRGMIRHMMLYHADQFTDPEDRVPQARALLDFLSGSVPTHDSHFGLLLKSELELIRNCSDSYLFHDHLAETNEPLYFHQFVDRAGRHGLQYLAEAELPTMLTRGFPEEVRRTLEEISDDIVRSEQYMDFLRARFFRQTLLCHAGVSLDRELTPTGILRLLAASAATPERTSVNLRPGVQQSFRAPSGLTISTASAATKAALCALRDHWPRALHLHDLADEVMLRLEGSSRPREEVARGLADDLLHCFASGVIELRGWQADFVTGVTPRPSVTVMARIQADAGLPVVTQRHELARLDALGAWLVPLLDGTRNRTALLRGLLDAVNDGELSVEDGQGEPPRDGDRLRELLEQSLERSLSGLAGAALLVS